MYRFDHKRFSAIRKEKRLPLSAVVDITKEIDPEGKGISDATVHRLGREVVCDKVTTRNTILGCMAIGVSPRTMIIEEK